jgi:CHASE2 domain-containing sensor protein
VPPIAAAPRSSFLVAGVIALCVAAAVLGARTLGWLEAFELVTYDACIRLRASHSVPSARVAS